MVRRSFETVWTIESINGMKQKKTHVLYDILHSFLSVCWRRYFSHSVAITWLALDAVPWIPTKN